MTAPRSAVAMEARFASAVLRLRTARGWTLQQLADEAGVSGPPVVHRIEVYARPCLLRTAWAIAGAFETTVEAMIAGDDLPGGAR